MRECWQEEPARRPTFELLLQQLEKIKLILFPESALLRSRKHTDVTKTKSVEYESEK